MSWRSRPAEKSGDVALVAEALRRLGVAQHHRGERSLARDLCERSHQIAAGLGDPVLAGEALNALAGFEFEAGAMRGRARRFHEALALGGASAALRGRIEQNLGILANIQGDHGGGAGPLPALARGLRGQRRRARLRHRLPQPGDGERRPRPVGSRPTGYFRRTLEISASASATCISRVSAGSTIPRSTLRGSATRTRARGAEAALAIFDQLGARLDKADAYKVIGRVYRETGRWALAESRLARRRRWRWPPARC